MDTGEELLEPADLNEVPLDRNQLTPDELKIVARGCLQALKEAMSEARSASLMVSSPRQRAKDHTFVNFLVTATLCLAMAPRSQVLMELRVEQTFVRESDGRYWVKMPTKLNKNAKPTLFGAHGAVRPVPGEIRPRLLQPSAVDVAASTHSYLSFKRSDSAPRVNFSELTCVATQQLLGRPVNAHAFRGAFITTYYSAGAMQSDMSNLASIMAHDPATARNYYYRPQMAQTALGTSRRIVDLTDVANSSVEEGGG